MLVVNSSFGVNNLSEFATKAKGLPEGVTWGSPGLGSQSYLSAELLFGEMKLKNTHIPYEGGARALSDLLGGQINAAVLNLTSAVPHIKAGTIKALGITADKRLPAFPEIPTFVEEGFPQVDTGSWYGLVGPRGMPRPLVDTINTEVRKVLALEEMRKQLALQFIEPQDWDVDTFDTFFKGQFDRWGPVVKATGAAKQ